MKADSKIVLHMVPEGLLEFQRRPRPCTRHRLAAAADRSSVLAKIDWWRRVGLPVLEGEPT